MAVVVGGKERRSFEYLLTISKNNSVNKKIKTVFVKTGGGVGGLGFETTVFNK